MTEPDPLQIFALDDYPPSLRTIQQEYWVQEAPISFSFGVSNDNDIADIDSTSWDAMFVRWMRPTVHDVCLVVCERRDNDEDAEALIDRALQRVGRQPKGEMQKIVVETLNASRIVISVQFLPALLDDQDHLAWDALGSIVSSLATLANGIIYVEGEGFYDDAMAPLVTLTEEE